jgi:hypothetical protein
MRESHNSVSTCNLVTETELQILFIVELYTILILAAWPVLVLIHHILVLVGWYFGRYFEH